MTQRGVGVEVVRVWLTEASWQTHRELNGLDSTRYPVIVQLSRPLDPFEAVALDRLGALVRQIPDQPGLGMIADTTLPLVKNSMFRIQRELADALALAVRLRDAAAAADLQMARLVNDINAELGAQRLPGPPAIAAPPDPALEPAARILTRAYEDGTLSIGA